MLKALFMVTIQEVNLLDKTVQLQANFKPLPTTPTLSYNKPQILIQTKGKCHHSSNLLQTINQQAHRQMNIKLIEV